MVGGVRSYETLNIIWTNQALEQLASAHTYLESASSQSTADKQIAKITSAIEHLADFPELGRPGRLAGTRELVIQGTSHVVAYRIRGGSVRLLAVLHGARRWPRNL